MTERKEELFREICHNVLKLELKKGHLLWTISDLSRLSNVPRPTIYYYLGKEKEQILKQAWIVMLQAIFGETDKEALGVQERIKLVVKSINEMPYLFVLFFLEKNSSSEIGELIREQENKLLNLLANNYPELSSDQVLEIYIKELGAVAYRNISDKTVSEIFPK